MITGEPMPVEKAPGDRCHRRHAQRDRRLRRCAPSASARTRLLAQIVRMVAEAQRSRAPVQHLADRVAAWFVPAVVVAAARDVRGLGCSSAPSRALAACARRGGRRRSSSPARARSGSRRRCRSWSRPGAAPRAGVLVKDAEALERLATVDTLVVDKTGTLTEGQARRSRRRRRVGPFDAGVVLRLAAAVERASEHPLAAAIVRAAERGVALPPRRATSESVPASGVASGRRAASVARRQPRLPRRAAASRRRRSLARADGAARESGQTVDLRRGRRCARGPHRRRRPDQADDARGARGAPRRRPARSSC